jgi:hypothetical protein
MSPPLISHVLAGTAAAAAAAVAAAAAAAALWPSALLSSIDHAVATLGMQNELK